MSGVRSPYDSAFAAFDSLNSMMYENHITKLKSSLKENPSSFWNLVNSKRSVNGLPKLMHDDTRSTMNESEQAQMFADFFSSNFSSSSTATADSQVAPEISSQSDSLVLDEFFVFDQLLNIKTTVGAGPDGIHPLILQNCAPILYAPLTCIFNESLQTGVFPDAWKRYSVTPIFKKGARSNIKNYRCIAKLQTIAKFFERCVNIHLTRLITPQLYPNQHGFTKRRSTVNNLMDFIHYSIIGLNTCGRVDVLNLDFSKAFDKVNHDILLRKLASFNIPSNVIKWLKSYLSDRRQYVKLRSAESSDFIVNSGVPQGSHIGPIIFLLFINDLPSIVRDDIFMSMFADVVRVARPIASLNDSIVLQSTLNDIQRWCEQNDLHLNIEKCSVLSLYRGRNRPQPLYCLGDHLISTTDEQRDLGVIIDAKLNFKSHVDMIVSKATQALGFVKRFGYNLNDQSTLKALYSALVQSRLDYCSTIWFTIPQTRADAIESVLKQFTMFALNEYQNESNNFHVSPYENRLERTKLIKLSRRRINTALIYLYDLTCDTTHSPYVKSLFYKNDNNRNFRNAELFRIRDSSLSRTTAPITQICKYANLVKDIFIEATSRNNFKKRLHEINDDVFI